MITFLVFVLTAGIPVASRGGGGSDSSHGFKRALGFRLRAWDLLFMVHGVGFRFRM